MPSLDSLILKTESLSKNFGALQAVHNVDIAVQQGEIRSIIGPNGAGKTTFFNMLSGLLRPNAGKVLFKGRDITGQPPHRISHLGIAKTFQLTNIFPGLSTMENLRVACQSRRKELNLFSSLSRLGGVAAKAEELLKTLGLESHRESLASNLSHGEQRHLEIGLALATDPELLLLDEPTSGMTPGETKETTDLIRRTAQGRGLTVLIIEHDMSVVMDISDFITVLHEGRKIAEGTVDEIRNNEAVINAYLGREV